MMHWEYPINGMIVVALLFYLSYAIIYPEKF